MKIVVYSQLVKRKLLTLKTEFVEEYGNQKAVEILPGDTPEILQRRVMEQAEWILLPRAAEQICQNLMMKEETAQ